jgi:DNA-binding NtrC family response regulator
MTQADRPLRILVVDDDADLLTSLRVVFGRERPRWDMTFVTSGGAALAELRRQPCDVVVSDLGIPDMDGAALLEAVRAEFPATIRIVMSGTADAEVLERAWRRSHVMVNKSAQHQILRDAIARAVA